MWKVCMDVRRAKGEVGCQVQKQLFIRFINHAPAQEFVHTSAMFQQSRLFAIFNYLFPFLLSGVRLCAAARSRDELSI